MVTMLVTLTMTSGAEEASPPETLQMDLQRYVAPEGFDPSVNPLTPTAYGHLQELSDLIQGAIESQVNVCFHHGILTGQGFCIMRVKTHHISHGIWLSFAAH
jgi:hypothetical protein